MFRTRDFLFLIGATVFLLVAIGITVVLQKDKPTEGSPVAILVNSPTDTEYVAEISESQEILSREDRLLEMREKIAAGGELSISAPESVVEEAVDTLLEAEENQDNSSSEEVLLRCAEYAAYNQYWTADGISAEIVEGSRVFYRQVSQDIVSLTDVQDSPADSYRVAVLQLPVQSFLTSTPNCLSSDVVGIAHDGSLIRNSEVGLYGVFGEGTMIGYALDGHPIYGVSEASSGVCGGRMVGGEYRYFLSDKRETILNCFVSVPAVL